MAMDSESIAEYVKTNKMLEEEKEALSLENTKLEQKIEALRQEKEEDMKKINDKHTKDFSALETEKNNLFEELQDNQRFKNEKQ